MRHILIDNRDGTFTLNVDFADEKVILQGTTVVRGNEATALAYLSVFEYDLRNNFHELFPPPPPPETPIEIFGGATK